MTMRSLMNFLRNPPFILADSRHSPIAPAPRSASPAPVSPLCLLARGSDLTGIGWVIVGGESGTLEERRTPEDSRGSHGNRKDLYPEACHAERSSRRRPTSGANIVLPCRGASDLELPTPGQSE